MKLPKMTIAILGLILTFPALSIGVASAQARLHGELGTNFTRPRNNPSINDEESDKGLDIIEVVCTNNSDDVTITFRDYDMIHIAVRRAGRFEILEEDEYMTDEIDHIAVATFRGNDTVTVNVESTFSRVSVHRLLVREEPFNIFCELGDGNDDFDNSASPFPSFVNGGRGVDELIGGSNTDFLSGNPILYTEYFGHWLLWVVGDEVEDTVIGNAGDDELNGEYVLGGDGDDIISSSEEGNIRRLPNLTANYAMIAYGGEGEDDLYGTPGTDFLYGQGDGDEIRGFGGADFLSGGGGGDRIYGFSNNFADENTPDVGDMIWGGPGDDDLHGGTGNDRIWGGDNDDRIWGGAGSDQLMGESGDDYLNGSHPWIDEDGEDDYLVGGADNDVFTTYYYHSFNFRQGSFRAHEEEPQDLESGDTWEQIEYTPFYGWGW